MKTLAFIVRKRDVSRDEFRDHYESVHAPLAIPILQGVERYRRHHVREEYVGKAPFDCMTSFWWSDVAELRKLMSFLESDEGAAIRADELSFMTREANRFCPVHDRLLRGTEDAANATLLVLASRPPDTSPENFADDYEGVLEKQLDELEEAKRPAREPTVRFCIQSRTPGAAPPAPDFDCATLIGFDTGGFDTEGFDSNDESPGTPPEEPALAFAKQLCQAVVQLGGEAVALRVSEHESRLPS